MIAWGAANLTSFLAQLALIIILSGFGKSQPKIVEKKTSQTALQEKVETPKPETEGAECEDEAESSLETASHIKSLFQYTESSIQVDNEELPDYGKNNGDEFGEIQTLRMDENDIEQRIWAQFVRKPNKSEYSSSQRTKSSNNSNAKSYLGSAKLELNLPLSE